MTATTFHTLPALRASAAHLLAHPDTFGSVIPGLLAGMAAKDTLPAWHAAIMNQGDMIAVATWTHPGRPFVVASLAQHDHAAAPLLARAAADSTSPFQGVMGRQQLADLIAHEYARIKPATISLYRRLALYRCDAVTIPPGTTQLRPATESDLPTTSIFAAAFAREVNEAGEDPATVAQRLTTDQRLWLLCDGDQPGKAGLPVSIAAALGDLAPGSTATRVGFVYTPPAYRRRGHAARATALLTHHLLQFRPIVSLYADLANPTSNHIYQTIGYTHVTDCTHWQFG
jgi:predicted GNAT family acetyltransferase